MIGDVNREDNMVTMADYFHNDFGKFRFALESTTVPNRYRLKKFPRHSASLPYPPGQFVTFTNHDGRFELPSPELLAVHASIGNILNATGRGEEIEKLIRDYHDAPPALKTDGSTDIGSLLSVSQLSVLSSSGNKAKDTDA
jgi:hypothetical protein